MVSPAFFLMTDAFCGEFFKTLRHVSLASRIDNAFLHSFKGTVPKNPRIIPVSFQKPEINKRIMQHLAGAHTTFQE
jgi:transcriptional regulator of met regulon